MHTVLTSTKNSLIKADDAFTDHDVITHAQTTVGNGDVIVSTHDLGIRHIGTKQKGHFRQSPHWYQQIKEISTIFY
jgi:hypothetical protein